jgi:Na+/H+-dicarboxylate symporter
MSKKFGITYLIILSFLMSLVLGLVVPAINTGSASLPGFLIIFGLSFVLTIVLGLALPIPRLSAWFCDALHQDPHSGLGKIFSNAFSTTLMMLVITFVMVAVLTGVGEVDGTNYLGRYITGFLHVQPILVITVMFLDPIASSVAKAIVKETPNTQAVSEN